MTSAIAAVSQLLREVADLGLWTLRPAETADNLTAIAQLRHQLTELELRNVNQADRLDLGAAAGAADTSSHWANTTRQTKRDAKRRLELAHALDHDHEPVRDAMAAGQRVRGAGGGDRQGRRRAPGRAPPRRRGPPDRLRSRA